jgi:hypothetical protein
MSIMAQVSGNSDLFLSRCADEENLRKSLSNLFVLASFKKRQKRELLKRKIIVAERS